MKIAFFGLLLIAAKASQTTVAAQGIVRAQNKVKSVRALIGENSDDNGIGPSVIGGKTLDRDVWEQSRRYLVDLRRNGDGLHSCGATKISARVVLTTAHCFTINDSTDPNFGNFRPGQAIQFNRYAQNDNTGVITIELCQTEGRLGCDGDDAYVVRHPDWDATTLQNDIALIFLQEESEQQVSNLPNVALNCVPNAPVDGQDLEVFGWGWTSYPTPVRPNEIQTATIKALTDADCGNVGDNILCTKQAGISAAPGDSGGPLVIIDENGNSLQVGVSSYIQTPDPTANPSFFARVSSFCDWIENAVCAEIFNDPIFCQETAQPTSQPTSNKAKASKQTKQAKASKRM